MTVCKIVLKGHSLRPPTEKLIKCFHEMSKNPFGTTWTIDGHLIEGSVDLLMIGLSPNNEKSSLENNGFVLDHITPSAKIVTATFQIPNDPPFELINNVHRTFASKGLSEIQLIYHGYRGKFGLHRVAADGTVDASQRDREEASSTNQINVKNGQKATIGTLDLDSSATFVQKVPKGEFADFLKEHGFEY